jgi:hypothetical protein
VTVGSDARRAIAGATVGLLCGAVLALLSWFLYGGGGSHGSSIPLLLSSAPLGVFALLGKLAGGPYVGYGHSAALLGTPLVWAALGWSAALSGRGRLRLFPILALLHYASGLALVATAGEEPARLQRLLRISPEVVMWATIYLAGHAALWSSLRAGSDARRAIAGAVVGLSCGTVLAFLALGAVGGGHGTMIPFLFSSAPLGVLLLIAKLVGVPNDLGEATLFTMHYGTPLIWAAIGSLAALSGHGKRLGLAQAVVLLQYASGFALVAAAIGLLGDMPLWRAGEVVAMWATVYLIGQAALWYRLTRRDQIQSTA